MKYIVISILILFSFIGCSDSANKQNSFEKAKSLIGIQNIVLEIGSSSCKSCIEMKKIIYELKNNDPNLPIAIVDVYDDPKSFSYFKIQMIPTQIVFNQKGEEVYRHVGGLPKEELLKLIELSKKDK